jgi:heme o synthase
MIDILRTYYHLTKPGIIYGNTLTVIGGFLFASGGHIDFWRLSGAITGTALVIASGCVTNNYLDRELDKKMTRTKKRALVTGIVSGQSALIFSAILGLLGEAVLYLLIDGQTAGLALFAWFMYVVVYGIAKRRGIYGTIVGSISGSMPVVIGYSAGAASLDAAAGLLFLIMAFWQMPHFYAIALYRRNEYAAANLPVLSVKASPTTSKVHILSYISLFILTNFLLFSEGHAGIVYGIVMTTLGLLWFRHGALGFKAKDNVHWAKSMFSFSLIVLLAFSILISLNPWLP